MGIVIAKPIFHLERSIYDMRKIVIAAFLFLSFGVNAQEGHSTVLFPVKGEIVTVTDW